MNNAGNVLLDKHVAQKERVTDYRTRFSGIRPSDLIGAPSLEEVQAEVAAIFKGRTVVGHSITNDLTVRQLLACATSQQRALGLLVPLSLCWCSTSLLHLAGQQMYAITLTGMPSFLYIERRPGFR